MWSATRAAVIGLVLLTACGRASDPAPPVADDTLVDDAITVGSFEFTESVLLAEIYSQALERSGIRVERAFGLGPREFVAPAVAVGLIELVPEYAGSAATFLSRGEEIPPDDPGAAHAQLVAGLAPHPVEALAAAPAENANAFVVTATTAERHHLRSLSDLAPLAGDLIFGGPPECNRRALCLAGLAAEYGIEFGTVVALDAGGPLTEQALLDGAIDVGLMFSSGSAMTRPELVELDDDRGLQPAENITPIMRREVQQRWGDRATAALDAVSARLTNDELRRLNAAVEGRSADAAGTATAWLDRMGLP